MKKEQTRTSFKSRWGFILASVGSAVGMANVWGFPNKMGSNGGGAFLLIYLLFIFLFSYVGLPAEFAIGRWFPVHRNRLFNHRCLCTKSIC